MNHLGAGIAMLGTIGAGLGLGAHFSSWMQGIARNPQAADKMNGPGFIGLAMIEAVALLCFVIAFMLLNAGQ
ncbi:MAG: F0F1 ATP synthase subunit C [Alphaproteobacteria bacterium]|nr:F0F1 ATP synthase subunit C [Alphaproteobacteria bacterium]